MDNINGTIKIEITGKFALGKTCISREIFQLLKEHGFNVEWNEAEHYRKVKSKTECISQLKSIKSKVNKIIITENIDTVI